MTFRTEGFCHKRGDDADQESSPSMISMISIFVFGYLQRTGLALPKAVLLNRSLSAFTMSRLGTVSTDGSIIRSKISFS